VRESAAPIAFSLDADRFQLEPIHVPFDLTSFILCYRHRVFPPLRALAGRLRFNHVEELLPGTTNLVVQVSNLAASNGVRDLKGSRNSTSAHFST
jgi:hypothetical protein